MLLDNRDRVNEDRLCGFGMYESVSESLPASLWQTFTILLQLPTEVERVFFWQREDRLVQYFTRFYIINATEAMLKI